MSPEAEERCGLFVDETEFLAGNFLEVARHFSESRCEVCDHPKFGIGGNDERVSGGRGVSSDALTRASTH